MSAMPQQSFPPMICPFDHSQLDATHERELRCRSGHAFAIRGGIPRLLKDEENYAEAFGKQWIEYRVTQLDSYTGTQISKDRLRKCLGEALWRTLCERGKIEILESGCGAGRFTEVLLQFPGASVTSTDLSSAVEPNKDNCPLSDRHRVIQCDINHLPFPPEQYDIVICLGVVQHTKSPERTISDLYSQVKPGGWLIIDHYTHTLSYYTKFSELALRPILKRLSPARGIALTKALTRIFFPLHKAVRNVKALQMVLSRFSPLLTYYHLFPQLGDKLQYEWAELDTHDSLTDYYKHLRSQRAIRTQLQRLGSTNLWIDRGVNGVEARCQKPPRD
ncbi:MAG TPA: class I SAM-dependent methyltransferase [Steroidobacteraceae bacterium]|nr:class I SAM-dependent methyltransferase [Steroidobacteraceae bacterium]